MSSGNADLKSLRRRIVNTFYRWKMKVRGPRETIRLLGRKIHSNEWRQRRNHWSGSRDSCDMWEVFWEPKSPWFVSSSVPHGLSTLLLPARLLLLPCIVSGHLIPTYTQDHLSRNKGFSIWMQEYLMELRIRSTASCCKRLEPKTIKVTQNWIVPSISSKRESLVSVTFCTFFFSSPLSLPFLPPSPLPRCALFVSIVMPPNLSSSFTSLLSLNAQWKSMSHCIPVLYFEGKSPDWPRLGQVTPWFKQT